MATLPQLELQWQTPPTGNCGKKGGGLSRARAGAGWLLVVLLIALCGLCEAAPARRALPYVLINKRQYILLADIAAFYGMRYACEGKTTTLSSKYSRLVFKDNSRVFTLNGVTANLSYAVARYQGKPALSVSDTTLFLDPILRTATIKRRHIRHIVIDAGHGGNDPGTQSGKTNEKDINLLMARRVAAILRKRGYKVSFTRTTDETCELKERVERSKKNAPDLFLSLHCNAAQDASVQGIETYVPNPKGTPSSGGNTVATSASASNQVDRENALLGFLLQKNLLRLTKAHDRGIKRKQFYVIRGQACPSALIELGFLSNRNERLNLSSAAYQDKLATAICDAVQQFEATLKPKSPVNLRK